MRKLRRMFWGWNEHLRDILDILKVFFKSFVVVLAFVGFLDIARIISK